MSGKMEKISFDPMKFGSESDLSIALTELKWIEKSNGRISENDFLSVSQKYLFPIDFLKKGLEGFSYPKDWLISKSKWFTILYSWVVKDKECSLDLFRLQFPYIRANFVATYLVGFSIAALFYIDFTLQLFVHIDPLQRFLGEIFPFVLFIASLVVGFWIYLDEKKTKINEYSEQLRANGLGYIVPRNEEFIKKNHIRIAFAGNTLLRKLEESNSITGFLVGAKEEETKQGKKGKIPIFYVENPHVEYRKRIEELSRESTRKQVQKS